MLPVEEKMLSSKGLVLLTALVFLQILSLLGLSMLDSAKIALKIVRTTWQKDEQRSLALDMLGRIEHRLEQSRKLCLVPASSAAKLAQRPLSWWQGVSCRDKVGETEYYYVVEPLGSDACGVVGNAADGQPNIMLDYYRFTLLAVHSDLKTMVQSTIASRRNGPPTVQFQQGDGQGCLGRRHDVILGRQMWRELEHLVT